MELSLVADTTSALDMLHPMAERVAEPRPMLSMLGGLLEDYEREVFATAGRGKWPADDTDTVELKGSARVLVDTGDLLDALTTARIQGDSVVVDQGKAFYAAFLKEGARGMPKRDPAPVPDQTRLDQWSTQLLGYIVEGTSS